MICHFTHYGSVTLLQTARCEGSHGARSGGAMNAAIIMGFTGRLHAIAQLHTVYLGVAETKYAQVYIGLCET